MYLSLEKKRKKPKMLKYEETKRWNVNQGVSEVEKYNEWSEVKSNGVMLKWDDYGYRKQTEQEILVAMYKCINV